jgi:hypothetical protein
VAHLKTELQEVEAQLLALYEKRDGLRQVLGATIGFCNRLFRLTFPP